jgi:hypothetical protein
MTREVNATRRLPAVLLVLLLSTASLSLLAITPAVADTTVDCGATPSDPACTRVEPLLTCVWTDASGGLTAVFGYNNSSTSTVIAPVGSLNAFSPSPAGRGQTTTFPPGRVSSAFSVAWSGGSITWSLLGRTRTAAPAATPCSSAPAPALAEAGVILAFLLVGVLFSVAVFRERGGARPTRLLDRLLPR